MSRTELVYGIHAVQALIEQSPGEVLELWLQAGNTNPALNPIVTAAARQGIAVQSAPRGTLDRFAGGGRHQGVVARRRRQPQQTPTDLPRFLEGDLTGALFLVLDGVEDPRNLGACLRVADGAGVRAVIRPLHRGVGLTGTAAKVASGAAESVPVVAVPNLARALKDLKEGGVWIVGADAQAGRSLYETDLSMPAALVLGGEGRGLRRLTRDLCDFLVGIPMAGSVESLNVAVAAGICLYEAVRQRRPRR